MGLLPTCCRALTGPRGQSQLSQGMSAPLCLAAPGCALLGHCPSHQSWLFSSQDLNVSRAHFPALSQPCAQDHLLRAMDWFGLEVTLKFILFQPPLSWEGTPPTIPEVAPSTIQPGLSSQLFFSTMSYLCI